MRKRAPIRNSADIERAENSSRPLSDVIQHFLRVHRMSGRMDEVEVREAWREVFGTAVENRTRKLSLKKDGTLICMLDSGPLKEEFQHGKQEIVDRLNEHMGRKVVSAVRIL
ncbi:MAG: DUF721 domain-containing protein [Bacteroidetes bacterium]|nr:DUF721 domain-containing protein [Bacteroidota bacterium]MDA0904371.1 DUF721 domain-containing protein [Bacteroidota bacterium]MDA1243056.1 DUF721 domain-containing protein [Bacteroidota bacterium]